MNAAGHPPSRVYSQHTQPSPDPTREHKYCGEDNDPTIKGFRESTLADASPIQSPWTRRHVEWSPSGHACTSCQHFLRTLKWLLGGSDFDYLPLGPWATERNRHIVTICQLGSSEAEVDKIQPDGAKPREFQSFEGSRALSGGPRHGSTLVHPARYHGRPMTAVPRMDDQNARLVSSSRIAQECGNFTLLISLPPPN